MKKIIASAVMLFLAVTCSTAWAIPLATVGGIDTLLKATNLKNSGDSTVLSWVEDTVGPGISYSATAGKIEGNASWVEVDDNPGVYAMPLAEDFAYFLVKTGKNEGSPYSYFLFENGAGPSWAVVDLNAQGIKNIGKISHISQFAQFDNGTTPVPEPSTMLLLGGGLLVLCWYGQKRKSA